MLITGNPRPYSAIMWAMEGRAMQLQQGLPQGLVGTWRRFGLVGPVYEIMEKKGDLPGGDSLMRVRVVETGEEVDYKLTDILDDPAER